MLQINRSSSKSSIGSTNSKLAFKWSKTSQEDSEEPADVGKPKPEGLDIYHSLSQYDCCSYIVHCATHDKVLLAVGRQEPLARWKPFTPMPPSRSWKDGALMGFCMMLAGSDMKRFEALKSAPPFESSKCLQVLRLQQPQTHKFVSRVIYYFKLKSGNSDAFVCCQPIPSAPHLEWFPIEAVCGGQVANLWSPEMVHYCQLVSMGDDTLPKTPPIISEISLEETFLFVPRFPPRNSEEAMLKSLNITQVVVERVFADWMDHLFPGSYMCADSFTSYMAKHKFETDATRAKRLFAAFDNDNSGFLSFHKFLLGLACFEQNCIHGELRAKFVFRYYNTDRSGQMTMEQLQVLVADTCTEPTEVETKLAKAIAIIGGPTNQSGPWTEKQFTSAVGSRRFRGTSQLCRSTKAIFAQISQSIAMKGLKLTGCKKVLGNVIIKRKPKEVCSTCAEKKYELASHLVHFYADGRMASTALAHLAPSSSSPPPEPKSEDKSLNCLTAQQYSEEFVFKSSSTANAVLRLVREFNAQKGTAQRPCGLMTDRVEDLWKLLLLIYDDIEVLLKAELKCHRVYSPCYVMGDLHGNLEDLLSLERTIWSNMPCLGANYLFLGDYVDRGQWSFECALYLMAFKLLCPNKVTLLRGNHEVRSMQMSFTYKNECITKYGESFGFKIWELTNRVFDKLPVCAVIDDSIFCAHGGIPRSARYLEQIAAIRRNIRHPRDEPIIWEIMWNDPANMDEFLDICEIENVCADTTGGFVFNTQRGTAFKYNEEGATRFLEANMLTNIIRAHEVITLGYEFNFGTKCVTIFSSSHYCGLDNDCCVMLADNQRLRVVHVDTTNNQPAIY